jgi:hypothetical protein
MNRQEWLWVSRLLALGIGGFAVGSVSLPARPAVASFSDEGCNDCRWDEESSWGAPTCVSIDADGAAGCLMEVNGDSPECYPVGSCTYSIRDPFDE